MAAHPPDFALLYAWLGLPPDCTLEQFKHACRRRIAELHPDKASPDAAAGPDLPISDLTALYVSAIRFHRRHGRLPGAPVASARLPMQEQPQPSAHVGATTTMPVRRDDAHAPAWRVWAYAAMAAALLTVLLTSLDREPPTTAPGLAAAEAASGAQVDAIAAAAPQLELGMDQATVLAIQGEPLQHDERDWLYGPSWIRFEEGRVVDWYSSPLRRLRTPTPTPAEGTTERTGPR